MYLEWGVTIKALMICCNRDRALIGATKTLLNFAGYCAKSVQLLSSEMIPAKNAAHLRALSGDAARAAFDYCTGSSVHGLPAASTVTTDAPVRSVTRVVVASSCSSPIVCRPSSWSMDAPGPWVNVKVRSAPS